MRLILLSSIIYPSASFVSLKCLFASVKSHFSHAKVALFEIKGTTPRTMRNHILRRDMPHDTRRDAPLSVTRHTFTAHAAHLPASTRAYMTILNK